MRMKKPIITPINKSIEEAPENKAAEPEPPKPEQAGDDAEEDYNDEMYIDEHTDH